MKSNLGIPFLLAGLMAVLPLAAETSTGASGPNARELLDRLDHNEVGATSHSIGTIAVEDRFGKKVTGFESWTVNRDKSLIVFTSGDEKGQKILRLGDTIYIAYPEADKPVKIQGAALRDSVAGSDFSYEDMAGDKGFSSRYAPRIGGKEVLSGAPCTILELEATRTGLAYPYLRIWVDDRDFSGRKMEKFSQNHRLLKTQEVQAVTQVAGRTVPTKILMIDHMKARSTTVIDLSLMELDVRVDPKLLTLEELNW